MMHKFDIFIQVHSQFAFVKTGIGIELYVNLLGHLLNHIQTI